MSPRTFRDRRSVTNRTAVGRCRSRIAQRRLWKLGALSSRSSPRAWLCPLFRHRARVVLLSLPVSTTHARHRRRRGQLLGTHNFGQLGDNTVIDRSSLVDVVGLAAAVSTIAAGPLRSCGLTMAGGLKCWGYNEFGQLGDNSEINRTIPVDVWGWTAVFLR
jgi:hypothetical protein